MTSIHKPTPNELGFNQRGRKRDHGGYTQAGSPELDQIFKGDSIKADVSGHLPEKTRANPASWGRFSKRTRRSWFG